MTYDDRAQLAGFHAENELGYPLLQDIDARHVDAYGIRNQDYGPDDGGYGVPHPGVLYVNAEGIVAFKLAYPGYRERPAFEAIHAALEARTAED